MFKISRSETETPDSLLPSELGKDEAGGNKLKGIQWPGMDCFDSAPEEKKRMRNQRKDLSVLKQMEETSASIEPTEQVWDFDGELQRTRDIYASPSIEGSPVRISHFWLRIGHLLTVWMDFRSRSAKLLTTKSADEVVVP